MRFLDRAFGKKERFTIIKLNGRATSTSDQPRLAGQGNIIVFCYGLLVMVCGSALTFLVAVFSFAIMSGTRDVGRAPEGYVWESSGTKYGKESGAWGALVFIICIVGAFWLVHELVVPSVEEAASNRLRKNGEGQSVDFGGFGCMGLIVGFLASTILAFFLLSKH